MLEKWEKKNGDSIFVGIPGINYTGVFSNAEGLKDSPHSNITIDYMNTDTKDQGSSMNYTLNNSALNAVLYNTHVEKEDIVKALEYVENNIEKVLDNMKN